MISPLRKINSIKKIRVKRHGLFIKLGEAQGLLLPQVAKNNNWDRETFLKHVCLKAGLEKDLQFAQEAWNPLKVQEVEKKLGVSLVAVES